MLFPGCFEGCVELTRVAWVLVGFLVVISNPQPWSCGQVGLREFFLPLHPTGYNLSFQQSVLEERNQSDSIEEPFDF